MEPQATQASQPIGELRPDIRKVFLFNVLKVGGISAAIIAVIAGLNSMVDIEGVYSNLQLGFNELGIKLSPLSPSTVIMWATFGLFGITIFILLFNYIALGKVRYVFYNDRVVMHQSVFMIQVKEMAIPYSNIVKVSSEKSVFNTGNITLELSGMDKKEAKLKFINYAQQAVANIQRLIQNYKASYYAQYAADQRIGNITGQLF